MSKLFGILSLMLLALVPAPAWACGDDGQRPCGGGCTWIAKGTCPFCIPWCHREPTFCHAGNLEQTEYAFLWTGEVVETPVCRRVSVPPPATVSVAQALAAGCRSETDITNTINEALSRSDLGTKTREALSNFSKPNGWATRSDVTDPRTVGYRATPFSAEIASLEAGKLMSKAERRLVGKSDEYIASFWQTEGPKIDPAQRGAVNLALQMTATASSDIPVSQYLSVALDYDVASAFGNVIYKFEMDPKSPVLGMRDCKLEGEVQIQPPGGTPIRNLFRFDKSKSYWERYQAGVWRRAEKDEL